MSLKQIAEMTGVSISTVSRVLNNREYNCASEEVKTRIWAAAKELQYVPNESARALKRGSTRADESPHRSFAVILERFHSLDDDPFFRELFRSVEQEAFASGCTIQGVYTAAGLSGGDFPWVSESAVRRTNQPGLAADTLKISQSAPATGAQKSSRPGPVTDTPNNNQPDLVTDAQNNSQPDPVTDAQNNSQPDPVTDTQETSKPDSATGTQKDSEKKADGYIILGRSTPQTLDRLKKHSKNIVSISRNPAQFEIDEIICDGKAAAARAMEFLIAKGHRRIGYIGDCSYEDRYVGYCESMIRSGLPLDYATILPTDQTTESGYEAMKKLLQSHTIDAVLCANDATALGALRARNEQSASLSSANPRPSRQLTGHSDKDAQASRKADTDSSMRTGSQKKPLQMPELISIDDIQAAQEVTPSLTTVHIPGEDMGKMAVKVLLDRIQRGHTEKIRVEFPSRLIVRESCR